MNLVSIPVAPAVRVAISDAYSIVGDLSKMGTHELTFPTLALVQEEKTILATLLVAAMCTN